MGTKDWTAAKLVECLSDNLPLSTDQRAILVTLVMERAKQDKDADRYRWLRHGDNDEKCIEFGKDSRGTRDDVWLMRGEKLDAACDAGMQHDIEQAAHTIAVPAVALHNVF